VERSRLLENVSRVAVPILHIGLYLSAPAALCAVFARDIALELMSVTVDLTEHCFRVAETLKKPRAGSGDLERFGGRANVTGGRRASGPGTAGCIEGRLI
jgi:hypothetical protein